MSGMTDLLVDPEAHALAVVVGEGHGVCEHIVKFHGPI